MGRSEKERIKTKLCSDKNKERIVILSQSRTDVFIDTKNYSHGGSPANLTITFADYFYSKYYYGRSVASADAKGEATAHTAGHNHRRKGPT